MCVCVCVCEREREREIEESEREKVYDCNYFRLCFYLFTVGISSWCFSGVEEWVVILERVNQDMKPQQQN